MNSCRSESRCLASLAVFRELYNSEKDIYYIISEFLKEVIITNGKHQFNLKEISDLLNTTYDFDIPEAVVKTSLKRLSFISLNQNIYIAENLNQINSNHIDEKQKTIEQSNNLIIEDLIQFVRSEKKDIIDETNNERIVHSFCSFLLDESNGRGYDEYISAFILKNKNNADFKSKINNIKEGVILYSGIKYNNKLNEIGSWKTNLTIFVDTEILFHLAGYNGEMYKSIFEDFFKFVKEINSYNPSKKIHLRYFREVKTEIENFFLKAESIVKGQLKPNPSITAMTTILDGCLSPSDVITKKTIFFEQLRTFGIYEDDYTDYYSIENHRFNIMDRIVLEKVSEDLHIDDVRDHLKYLNYISIHRKEYNNNNFENIKYILVSGNNNTLKVAWHGDVKETGNVPLATDLGFLTNKFWFKLNKGFGKDNYPKSFDVITKAQILLSKHLNDSVSRQYDDLQNKFKKGELTEQQAVATIVNLRKLVKKPEEISDEVLDDVLGTISESSIEKFILDQEIFKDKAKKQAEENLLLKAELTKKDEQIKKKEKDYEFKVNEIEETKRQTNNEKIHFLQNSLNEKCKIHETLSDQKNKFDTKAWARYRNIKIAIAVVVLGYYLLLLYAIIKFDWNDIEKLTYLFGIIPFLIVFIFTLIREKSLNAIKLLKSIKSKIFTNYYNEFGFNLKLFNEIDEEISSIKSELNKLKQEYT